MVNLRRNLNRPLTWEEMDDNFASLDERESTFLFFDTLQEALDLRPRPENGVVFEVRKETDPENFGFYVFDVREALGYRYLGDMWNDEYLNEIEVRIDTFEQSVDVELAGIRSDNAAFKSDVNQDLQQITAEKQVFESEAQDIKDTLANMTTTGKIYDSLADAIAESPKPADGTPFSVMGDGDNDGYYKFDSTQTDGVKFGRKFDRRIQVESISQLKNYKGRPGEGVDVLGYYEKGDGGGGLFYWDSASTEVDNGGTIIEATGISTGRWKRRFSGSVNVKWFGAKDQEGFDNYHNLQYVASNYNNIYFPESDYGYETTQTITVPASVKYFHLPSPLIYTGTIDEECLIIGSQGSTITRANITVNVFKKVISSWENENSIGVEIINPNTCSINIVQARNFTIGFQLMGANGGAAYNRINLGWITSNKIAVDLTNNSTNGLGWCNENVFFGGRIGSFSADNPGKSRYGVRVTSKNGDYYNNSNVIYKPSFELHESYASPGEAVPVILEYANNHSFLDIRNESNSPTTLRALNNSTENEITSSYGNISVEEAGNFPYTKSISGRQKLVNSHKNLVFHSGSLADKACYYDGDTKTNVIGCHLYSSASANIQSNISYIGISDSYITIPSVRGIGIFVDTTHNKRFFLTKDVVDGYEGRSAVRCYDAQGNVLTDSGSGHPYVKGAIYAPPVYNSSFGGIYRQATDSRAGMYFEVSEEVAKIAVLITGGTNSLRLKSFSLFSLSLNNSATPSTGLLETPHNIAIKPPTAGTWKKGKIVYNDNPATGDPDGWICTSSGTPGQWKSFGGNKITTLGEGFDLNDLTLIGTFKGENLLNAPDTGWWYIVNYYHSSGYVTQLAYSLSNPYGGVRHKSRTKYIDTWTEWEDFVSGASGSYTTADGKAVTVENGIITSITEPEPEE